MESEKNIPVMESSFRYPKTKFIMTASLFVVVLFVLAVVIATLPMRPSLFYISLIFGLYCFTLVLYGFSPLITSHTIEGNDLILRQGWYFRFVIPIENIGSIGPYEGLVYKKKVDIDVIDGINTLFVTSTKSDLINLSLNAPMKVGWFFGKRVLSVVVDLEAPEVLVDELSKRISSEEMELKTKGKHGKKPPMKIRKKK